MEHFEHGLFSKRLKRYELYSYNISKQEAMQESYKFNGAEKFKSGLCIKHCFDTAYKLRETIQVPPSSQTQKGTYKHTDPFIFRRIVLR
ncbi:MAG: hypothetical protein HY769_09015 [Candidatus Stahlbacteria bacterium]|nr:hypothetical protein [Candidatus Stahlbacteria bacterium]